MLRRIPVVILMSALALVTACTNKKVHNPLANVGSKQPDKVLFDRAMNSLKHNRFDVARLTLQTLINTYPDSEYIARAKLGVADSWYAEGGSAALAQAEIEYNDFKTFFPNMPEAAEAQLKIANIHYQQMEKPDRDYTHALRAEQEYRTLIMQFPESKLVPVAKQRLLEVQEVLAEREFRVGRFYYLRESYPAAIARLRSLINDYPLYSKADEALYLLGQSYEAEIKLVRSRPMNEVAKARLIGELTKDAAGAYSRILTRYPLMTRADDAKARLIALHQPVPRPTVAEVKQNKAEEDSRRETGMLTKVLRGFSRHPDVAQAARVGEPTMVDPEPVSASEVVQQATQAITGKAAPKTGTSGISIETVGAGTTPPPSEEAPRSDAAAVTAKQPGSNELVPNVPADAGELKPNVSGDSQALPPPAQVNEIDAGSAQGSSGKSAGAGKSADQEPADDALISSSKRKKKKGLRKLVPF
jgi:outer membrane protein assembly factor BamD